jgi:hypothetical protein
MYKSPLTKDQIKAIAAEIGVVDDCFLRGGKSEMIYHIISHLDTMRMFSTIIDTPESLKHAEEDKGRRDLFISKAQVTDDGVSGLAKKKPK